MSEMIRIKALRMRGTVRDEIVLEVDGMPKNDEEIESLKQGALDALANAKWVIKPSGSAAKPEDDTICIPTSDDDPTYDPLSALLNQ